MMLSLFLVKQYPALPFQYFQLKAGIHHVGRSKECAVVLNDRSVSRRHAQLRIESQAVILYDLGSRNGTFIDEERIESPHRLAIGSRVRFGDLIFLAADSHRAEEGVDSALETAGCGENRPSDPLLPLVTPGQLRILELIRLSEKQIAGKLGISQHTVHNHLRAIYQIFEVRSRTELQAKVFELRQKIGNPAG